MLKGRKCLLLPVFIAIIILLQSFLRQPNTLSTQEDNNSWWVSCAKVAWRYFQPREGLGGVDPDTGLSYAGLGWHYFTEWDLGTYILAIIDAEKIGILPREGPWGSTDRLNKIMDFLQNRELTSEKVAYLWYNAKTRAPAREISNKTTNVSDLGFLLIALHTLKTYRPEYAPIINHVVYERENITKLASDPKAWQTGGVYKWYVAHGFKFFGFDKYQPVKEALNTLRAAMMGAKSTTYNVTLPITSITSEPLILAAFTLSPEPWMNKIILKAYLAQENRYRATGKYTAFSEGNTALPPPRTSYIYEWIMTGSGEAWKVSPENITPIIYIKVGFAFYSLFRTQYALSLIEYVNSSFTDFSYGYWDGVDENGRVVNTVIDRTNGIILAAARYALENPKPITLSDFPFPFIREGFLNLTFVIGDTNHHPPYGWQAYTLDLIGSLGVASKLGLLSSTGYCAGMMDTWVTEWNESSRTAIIKWDKIKSESVISIGGPPVNLVSYSYEQLAASPFYQVWINGIPYLKSDLSGKTYGFNWGVNDYAFISISELNERTILVGWGLTHRGTVAACQILQYFDSKYVGLLSGSSMIIKWVDKNGDTEVDLGDDIIVIERWP